MVVVSVSSVLMVLVMSYITTQLHTRIVDLEHQLRSVRRILVAYPSFLIILFSKDEDI